ncbi:MATH domain and coiled-coil domain-containing protein At3g58210-like [Neltuma alba]|uniref:MATH domain and coiled-coil domain-containing protein At3g58210-like n=1 Tax=Neltuma alba TaxID=207710 RepID=UPI0010A34C07|nr:MATH domain and coiled-coil domain-containing protein At3g58210-like [Prosopis alba]
MAQHMRWHATVENPDGRKLRVYRGSQHGQYLGVYLEVADVSSFPQGWSVNAADKLTVVNQVFTKDSVTKGDINYMFSTYGIGCGYSSFMELTELQKPYNGYIWNDTCIVEVEFSQVSYEGPQIEKALGEKDEDLVKFKDLGLIEKALVPLLEEACLWHPSLMDCKQKRSPKFTEWAFTALGRVLQFLKNKKWKDMNENACEELQQLWGELAMSGLDLSWLEPLVKSSINMKGYADKVEKIKKLKLELMISETGMNIIKKKISDTEQSVEKIRKELVNAMEDLKRKI